MRVYAGIGLALFGVSLNVRPMASEPTTIYPFWDQSALLAVLCVAAGARVLTAKYWLAWAAVLAGVGLAVRYVTHFVMTY